MQEASKNAANRKEAPISFLKLAASGNLDEAYANYIGPNFRHHNPYFPGDAESLKAGMAEAHAQFADTTLQVQPVFEEDDLVAGHPRVEPPPDTPATPAVHICRFDSDRVAG